MTKEEAKAKLEVLKGSYQDLWKAREEDGSDCFWCCGGGDEWLESLDMQRDAILNEHPKLAYLLKR